ncbi:MAG TPA: hypothetical protein VN442_05875 [Bryobacteraceae bacterium]|nr:hypothetical protein [Bryobacteraceae bacterium]
MKRTLFMVAAVCGVAAGSGCAARDYRVAKVNGLHYVYPPGRKVDRSPLREQRVSLAGMGHPGERCRVAGEAFALEPGRRPAAVARLENVAENAYNQQRMRDAVEEFRVALERLETGGCLPSGGAHRVLEAMGERMTLLAPETVFLRYGFNRWRNYIDLRPGMIMGVQWAFSRGPEPWGTNLANMDIGSRHYTVRPGAGGSGLLLAQAGEAITTGGKPAEWVPDLSELKLPHYRLFFLTKYVTIQGQPERSATLLGVRTMDALREITPKFLENADLACQGKLTARAPECTSVDKKISFLPEVSVTVNGTPEYVTIGTDVRGFLNLKRVADVPFTLERRYGAGYRKVVFPAGDAAALGLPLLDGDRLAFTAPGKAVF